MNEFENEISKALNLASNSEIPSTYLKGKIFEGLDDVKSKRSNKRLSLWLFNYKAAAVFGLVIGFVLSVNVFPTFAAYMSRFPLMEGLVELVKFDKGLEEIRNRDKGVDRAVNKGYGKNASVLSEENGMVFTAENTVSDQKRMFITYSVKYDSARYGKIDSLWFNNLSIKGEGKTMVELVKGLNADTYFKDPFIARNIIGPGELGRAGVPLPKQESDKDKLYGWIEITKQNENDKFPGRIEIDIDGWKDSAIDGARVYSGKWSVGFDIPKEYVDAEPITHEGKNFKIEADKYKLDMAIDYTKVYPTVTALKIDVTNYHDSPKVFSLRMHLEDEKGQIYKYMEEGLFTTQGNMTPEFESSYFTKPRELNLVIEEIVDVATKKGIPLNQKVKLF